MLFLPWKVMGEAAPSSTGAQTDVPSGEKLIVILKMAGA